MVQRLAAHQQTAVRIRNRQWITAHPVSRTEPAFEISAPRVVGPLDRAERLRPGRHMEAASMPRHRQARTRQDRTTCAGNRPRRGNVLRLGARRLEFLGPPARMRCLGPQHCRAHLFADRVRVLVGRTRARLQPIESFRLIVRQQLVPGLPTDAEATAQLSHADLVLRPLDHKCQTLLHR